VEIFISYRPEDSASETGRIGDHLGAKFGKGNVDIDIDYVPRCVDFREHIGDAVGRCDALLVVIGANSLIASDGTPNPRLMNPADWVRIEVETALEREIPVIPVLLDKTRMPRADELPESMRALAFRNAVHVRPGADFRTDIARLTSSITVPPRLSMPSRLIASRGRAGAESKLSGIAGTALTPTVVTEPVAAGCPLTVRCARSFLESSSTLLETIRAYSPCVGCWVQEDGATLIV
jgi:hypothetical protein